MNEGEKSKGKKKKGDSVTFRLLKKMRYSNDVIELINDSINKEKCNEEILKALDFYVKYKHRSQEIELYTQFIDKVNDPVNFSKQVIEQVYVQYVSEKFDKLNVNEDRYSTEPKVNSEVNEELNITSNIEKFIEPSSIENKVRETTAQDEISIESEALNIDEGKNSDDIENNTDNIISIDKWNNNDEASEIFDSVVENKEEKREETEAPASISRAISSIRRRR